MKCISFDDKAELKVLAIAQGKVNVHISFGLCLKTMLDGLFFKFGVKLKAERMA